MGPPHWSDQQGLVFELSLSPQCQSDLSHNIDIDCLPPGGLYVSSDNNNSNNSTLMINRDRVMYIHGGGSG